MATPEIKTYDLSMYTITSVNLRKSPDKNSESLDVIPESEIVTAHIENKEDDWYFVSCENDKVGWINSSYLTEYKEELYVDILLEYQYQDFVRELVKLYDLDIDEYFIYGMMFTESCFDNTCHSSAGARGILQVLPSTWEFLYKDLCNEYPELSNRIVNDITDKGSNIAVGIYCVKYLQESCGCENISDSASRILTSYNRGQGGANSFYKAHGTYSSSYSQKVLRAAKHIRTKKTWRGL